MNERSGRRISSTYIHILLYFCTHFYLRLASPLVACRQSVGWQVGSYLSFGSATTNVYLRSNTASVSNNLAKTSRIQTVSSASLCYSFFLSVIPGENLNFFQVCQPKRNQNKNEKKKTKSITKNIKIRKLLPKSIIELKKGFK